MYEDPNLPEGWSRKVSQRQGGASTGKWDVYIVRYNKFYPVYRNIIFRHFKNSWFSPEGRKFRSRNELRQYLEKHNLDYNAEDFDFSIWGRGNRPPSKSSSSNNNSASSPVASGSPSSSAASPASNADGRCITLQNTRTFWHSCSIKGSRTIIKLVLDRILWCRVILFV